MQSQWLGSQFISCTHDHIFLSCCFTILWAYVPLNIFILHCMCMLCLMPTVHNSWGPSHWSICSEVIAFARCSSLFSVAHRLYILVEYVVTTTRPPSGFIYNIIGLAQYYKHSLEWLLCSWLPCRSYRSILCEKFEQDLDTHYLESGQAITHNEIP